MRLESALNTGREGVVAHGQAIAIVGDNISNANTIGYKNQRAVFADLLGESPNDRGSSVVSGAGDGVTVRDIQLNYDVGPIQSTGRELDVALSGNGFFLVGDPKAPQLTRSGSFSVDKDGFLMTSFGEPVLGYSGADMATLGKIDMRKLDLPVIATTEAKISGNLNSAATSSKPPANPLSFQEINAAASLTNTVATYDSLGNRHEMVFAYYRNGVNTWTVQAYVNGADVGQAADKPVLVGQTQIGFGTDGRIATGPGVNSILNANIAWSNGAAPSTVNVDFSSFSQFAGANLVTTVSQNGQGQGEIVGYDVSDQGVISAKLTNGLSARIGSIGVGTVTNKDGLVRSGSSTYVTSGQSGALVEGSAGTGPRSKLMSKSLEYSNVDLAGQFVELVVLQRAYAANSKVISTASEVIKDTVALVR